MLSTSTSQNINILILEDRIDDVDLVLLELRHAGFKVKWKHVDSEDAYLENLHAGIDIILADYSLPQFNASRALDILQQVQLDIPFIIVTGSISEEVAVECMKRGATDYLLKDRLSRLGPAVLTAMHEKRLRSEKRQAEEALRQSEEKFKTIFSEALDVIIVIDPLSGKILDINQAASRVLLYEAEDLLDQYFANLFPDDAPQSQPLIFENLRVYGAVFVSQKFKRADNSMCLMDLTATTIPWEDRRVILATLRDASERERAEAEYQRAQLLRVQLEKERELNDLKSRFISMVSHEFRTPLAAIQLTVSILEDYLDRLDPPQRARRFATINSQIKHMTNLLNDVLTISRAEAGALKFDPVMLDLDQASKDIIGEFEIAYENYTITYQAQGDNCTFYADEKLWHLIVTNLLSNALKYSPSGGIIRIRLNFEYDKVVLRVTDNGIGIPKKDQERLFEIFHRAANVGSTPGSGLGLAITKHAVELHAGTIHFESEEGKGTTFIVSIPQQSPVPSL